MVLCNTPDARLIVPTRFYFAYILEANHALEGCRSTDWALTNGTPSWKAPCAKSTCDCLAFSVSSIKTDTGKKNIAFEYLFFLADMLFGIVGKLRAE